jgi:tetratricopeptide (TPR) repeat protein
VKRLECLPLALVFAGSYISKTTIDKYLELYDKSWIKLHGTMNWYDYPERTIVTTWQISFDEVTSRDEGAAKLLQLWGYFDNQEIWYQLFQWSGYTEAAPSWLQKITDNEIDFLATVDILLNYSLIERGNSNDTYSMHSVVHDWIRASINKKDEDMLQIAITTVGLAVPSVNVRDASIIQGRLLPHATRCSQHLGQVNGVQKIENAYLAGLKNLGDLYHYRGRLTEAEAIYERALAESERTLGAEHDLTLRIVNNIGLLYWSQNRFAKSEAMYDRALVETEKTLGAAHKATLNIMNNMGMLYNSQGRLKEAEAMYERALVGKERAFGAEDVSALDTVYNIGLLYEKQGRLQEAETMYERSLAGTEKALGTEHKSTLETAHHLGQLYEKQGRLAEAEAIYQRALVGSNKALGAENKSTLNIAHYEKQDWLTQAEAIYERELAGKEKVFGAKHTLTISTVNNLGALYAKQGRFVEAEAIYKRILMEYEKELGAEHTEILCLVNSLIDLYKKQDMLAKANAKS